MSNAYVYIIANGSAAVKIGKARNPHSRLRHFQVGSHSLLTLELAVEYDEKTASKVEHATHNLLHSDRINGEWFSTSVEDAKKAMREAESIVKSRASRLAPIRSDQEIKEEAIRKEFGRRVRRRRVILEIDQRTLAPLLDMLPAQLCRLEKGGYRSINIAKLALLADALHTSVDYLLARSDDPGALPDSLELHRVA